MAGLVNLTLKAVTLQGFQLTADTDMHTALSYLSGLGYAGGVTVGHDASGTAVWQMWFQGSQDTTTQNAAIGDIIVIKNGQIASALTLAQFNSLYTVAS